MQTFQTLKDAPAGTIKNGTKVLVRADMDVALENGKIAEKYRLDQMLPTLNFLKEKGARIMLAGHIGRPNGKPVNELSTKVLKPYFDEILGVSSSGIAGTTTYELLENLRFDPREEQNDPSLAKELAAKADVYVNECFSTSHRNHTSFVAITKLLPSYAGLRLEKEVETLSTVIKKPARPLVALIGGTKIETKKPVIDKFIEVADYVLVGGKIGLNWNVELATNATNLLLPSDYAEMEKDIGLSTIETYRKIILQAKTVIWAGPMGYFEDEKFASGSIKLAQAIVDSRAFSIAGGGDTITFLDKYGFLDKFNFISTGGSAMLKFLAGDKLPGLEALGYTD